MRVLLSFSCSICDTVWRSGPYTMGGFSTTRSKAGFSVARKSHAAFSANFLDARYAMPRSVVSRAASRVVGVQSAEV